ncbi:unnamed protein product, partial [Prorocentrum cordatum]
AVASLARAYYSVPPPPDDLTTSGARSAFRGCGPGYACDGVVAGEFAAYQRGRLALPAVGIWAIDLAGCLPDHYQKLLGDGAAKADELDIAMDPILARSPSKFAVSTFVGVFFVRKKDGSLRIISGQRKTSAQSASPDGVALTSPEALGDLELPAGRWLWVNEGVVENFCNQFLLPVGLRADFAPPAVPRRALPRRLRGLFPAGAEREAPMGWNWAVELAQAANAEVLRLGPLGSRRWICSRRCAPAFAGREPAALLRIDDFASVGAEKETVQVDGDSTERQLRGRGPATHEVSGPQVDADLLGFHVDGEIGAIHIAPKRFWRLVLSLDYIPTHPLLSGTELERLIGHLIYVLLLRHE